MMEEQRKLAEEKERQRQIFEKRHNPKVERRESVDYNYRFADGMAAQIKKFRQKGTGGDALIIKIDHDVDELQIEQTLKETSVEDIAEIFEENANEPRYLLYIHKQKHSDGRTTYPICFVVFIPQNVPAHYKVMYTRPIPQCVEEFKVNKHYSLEDPEDLDVEWLEARIAGKN